MFWIFFHRKGITSQRLATGKQALKLTQTCIIRTNEGSEMYELFSPNFCWANSFLLRVTCRSGTGWLFAGVLLFSLESNAHMTTGCLKNQHDLHQGGTAVCPRRVSCILHLKNGACSKLNPFVCILLTTKQKGRRLWLPKVVLHIDSPPHLGPSRGFQPCSSESTCLNGFVPTDFDTYLLQSFCHFPTGQVIKGLTCVRQKHFKTSFQISAANTVHGYHS